MILWHSSAPTTYVHPTFCFRSVLFLDSRLSHLPPCIVRSEEQRAGWDPLYILEYNPFANESPSVRWKISRERQRVRHVARGQSTVSLWMDEKLLKKKRFYTIHIASESDDEQSDIDPESGPRVAFTLWRVSPANTITSNARTIFFSSHREQLAAPLPMGRHGSWLLFSDWVFFNFLGKQGKAGPRQGLQRGSRANLG